MNERISTEAVVNTEITPEQTELLGSTILPALVAESSVVDVTNGGPVGKYRDVGTSDKFWS